MVVLEHNGERYGWPLQVTKKSINYYYYYYHHLSVLLLVVKLLIEFYYNENDVPK